VVEPAEGGLSDASVTVAPAAPLAHDLTLDYEVVGIDAEADDFLAQSGMLVFPAGSTAAQEIVVTVAGDEVAEADETLHVRFTVAGSGTPLDPAYATVTIVDDDSGNGPPSDAH
jgi:hypothetical protein